MERFSFKTQLKTKFVWPHKEQKKVLENIPGIFESGAHLFSIAK